MPLLLLLLEELLVCRLWEGTRSGPRAPCVVVVAVVVAVMLDVDMGVDSVGSVLVGRAGTCLGRQGGGRRRWGAGAQTNVVV